jgi:hypothetical protein
MTKPHDPRRPHRPTRAHAADQLDDKHFGSVEASPTNPSTLVTTDTQ